MATVKELIKEAVEDSKLSSEEKKKQEEMLTEMLENGKYAKDVLNMPPDSLEHLYGSAYRLYNNGRYHDAELLFLLLTLIDPTAFRYQMGIAASLHMQKKFAKALDAYAACIPLDPLNPTPYYHAADCYEQLNDLPMAYKAYKHTIMLAGDNPKYEKIVERSFGLLNGIFEKLKAELLKAPEKVPGS